MASLEMSQTIEIPKHHIDLNQAFEKHRNGAAEIALCSHISADTFADNHSRVSGNSSIINSSLIASHARDSIIINSSLQNSQVRDSHIVNSSIFGSSLLRSVTADAQITGSKLADCIIAGLFGQTPELDSVNLDDCIIEGACRLIGPWRLSGTARIHEGEWYRAPRVRTISSENGVIVTITECINGKALIGGYCRDIRRWQRSGSKVGLRLGWPAELVREACLFGDELLDDPQSDRST